MNEQVNEDLCIQKDDRNLRGGNGKKRFNYKEQLKRNQRIKKKIQQSEGANMHDQLSETSEGQNQKKRYGNGKPKKQLKEQTPYIQQEEVVTESKKRQPKNRKN